MDFGPEWIMIWRDSLMNKIINCDILKIIDDYCGSNTGIRSDSIWK